ncbi:MAG: hypothetical protein JWR54_4033 [Mucilaginibacter sp.]|nr:hypothetical protein [Mucilaginibacter sp.]
MELIIDFDKIKDPSKREWLINSLKLMQIGLLSKKLDNVIEDWEDKEGIKHDDYEKLSKGHFRAKP